jgi:hypothetical protein
MTASVQIAVASQLRTWLTSTGVFSLAGFSVVLVVVVRVAEDFAGDFAGAFAAFFAGALAAALPEVRADAFPDALAGAFAAGLPDGDFHPDDPAGLAPCAGACEDSAEAGAWAGAADACSDCFSDGWADSGDAPSDPCDESALEVSAIAHSPVPGPDPPSWIELRCARGRP